MNARPGTDNPRPEAVNVEPAPWNRYAKDNAQEMKTELSQENRPEWLGYGRD
jgi:hypothetical protein